VSLTHLSLFSGIGGLDIAAEMAGIRTVGQCEWADFQTKILEKHWPDVPRWRDIRTLTAESFYERTGLRTVDIISGGFPCQPFSVAGKREGKDDDRYLWPEMLRVIREIRPAWVIGENVPGIINLALDTVLSDLENEGYATQPFVVPACGVDAPHKRERVCIIAYRNNGYCYKQDKTLCTGRNASFDMVPNVPHSIDRGGAMCRDRELSDIIADARKRDDNRGGTQESFTGEWRENESGIHRMDDGISEGIHAASSDSESKRLQGFSDEQICGGGYITDIS
jgi:DNA (cytosine-5)-methyltransferase 1